MDALSSNISTLNALYNKIILDLKNSSPIWEDFLSKSNKLHYAIKNVLLCSSLFWEAFQKIADLATYSQGATKEIGKSFTRLCMRQRLMENKLKILNNHLVGSLANPVQEKLEEWKRYTIQLDKDRIRDTKKAKTDWKKASEESIRLQKKAVKRGSMRGLGSLQNQVESALKIKADKFSSLQHVESLCVRQAMIHERERFCFLFSCMKPVMECQINLLTDVTSLDELMKTLSLNTISPDLLPVESEEIIQQIVDPESLGSNKSNSNVSGNTVISSGFGSRKSSVVSLNSHHSCSTSSGPSTTAKGAETNDISSGINRLSMTTSRHETSRCSGDYRVSDDDSKNMNSEINTFNRDDDDDEVEDDDDDDDDDEEEDDSEEDIKTPNSPSTSLWIEKLNPLSDVGSKLVASRHTISGTGAYNRPTLSPGVFEPLGKRDQNADGTLVKMDQSKQLYPNQAIPLPVYTNLNELTNAAQKKFSMVPQEKSQKKSCESEFDLSSQTFLNQIDSSGPDHFVSQYGSKTPGLRRTGLSSETDQDVNNQHINFNLRNGNSVKLKTDQSSDDEDITPTSSCINLHHPQNSLVVSPAENAKRSTSHLQQKPSMITGTPESHHINCIQKQASKSNHHRSNSYSEDNHDYENIDLSSIPWLLTSHGSASAHNRKEVQNQGPVVNELHKPLKIENSISSTAALRSDNITNWTDIDPDLPMPPPPMLGDEEIHMESMLI